MRISYTYDSIKAQRTKRGECPICLKKVSRSRTFEHTINPWNRNKDGTVRTPEEVSICVNAEADKWIPNFTHDKCKYE
jgi:hypothetical protein